MYSNSDNMEVMTYDNANEVMTQIWIISFQVSNWVRNINEG